MAFILPQLDTSWTAVRMPPGLQRPNLVIVRTGNSSLHKQWPKAPVRHWDLLLSHYGSAEPDCPNADIIVKQGAFKFAACHRLFQDIPWLSQYRSVWFCDDDIMTSWTDIDLMFSLFAEFGLDLAQPSLTANSFVSHGICRQLPQFVLRYTNFVEIMVPLLSAGGLKRLLPSLENAVTGWGLDYAWPKLLGYPRNKIGIIDQVAVHHTRPGGQGPIYNEALQLKVMPGEEMVMNLERYGVEIVTQAIYGLVLAQPQVLMQASVQKEVAVKEEASQAV